MNKDRVQAFSDGIFAILITILVLEFKIPHYTVGNLASAILTYWPTLFAYVLTYFYVGILWMFHHDTFQSIKYTTTKLNIINLVLIFFITLLSFSMSLLAETLRTQNLKDLQVSCAIYALLAFLISLFFYLIYSYIYAHPKMLEDKAEEFGFKKYRKYPILSTILYTLSFLLSYVNVFLGLIFLVFGILNHGLAYFRISAFNKTIE